MLPISLEDGTFSITIEERIVEATLLITRNCMQHLTIVQPPPWCLYQYTLHYHRAYQWSETSRHRCLRIDGFAPINLIDTQHRGTTWSNWLTEVDGLRCLLMSSHSRVPKREAGQLSTCIIRLSSRTRLTYMYTLYHRVWWIRGSHGTHRNFCLSWGL